MKQKIKVSKTFGLLTLVLLAAIAGFFVGKMSFSPPTNSIPLGIVLMTFALIIPAFLVVVAWHEGGHAVAGVGVGFDFKLYVVGPFMWEKQSAGWRFNWNKNVNIGGGLVLCMPTDTADVTNRYTIFAVGGPLASLILAVLSYAAYSIFFKNHAAQNVGFQLLGYFFFITALLSLAVFFSTAIPSHIGGFRSDGARVMRLQRGGDTARLEGLMLKFIAQTSSGIRPKLLNINELEEALTIATRLNEPFSVYLHGFLHQATFDNNEIEKAEKHLLNYINEADNIAAGLRNSVWLDAAFFYAYAKQDLEKAATFWRQFKPTAMIPQAQVFVTEAALSFLKNDKETALSKIENALKELPNMIDQGVAMALKDKLLFLKSSIASDSRF